MTEPPPPVPSGTPGVDRPEPVRYEPRRETQRVVWRTLSRALLVASRALLVACVLGLAAGAVTCSVVTTQIRRRMRLVTCEDQLMQLAAMLREAQAGDSAPAPRAGPALLLEWRGTQGRIRLGQEAVLLCPNDDGAADRHRESDLWDHADLDHPDPRLCSYAARDFAHFPLSRGAAAPAEPVFACLHHASSGGAPVSFSDGTVRFLTFAQLGISSGDELIAGPESKSEVLRPLLSAGPPPGAGGTR